MYPPLAASIRRTAKNKTRRYGMFNHVVYDVFVAGGDKKQGDEGLDSRCRFSGDLKAFTEKGLVFR